MNQTPSFYPFEPMMGYMGHSSPVNYPFSPFQSFPNPAFQPEISTSAGPASPPETTSVPAVALGHSEVHYVAAHNVTGSPGQPGPSGGRTLYQKEYKRNQRSLATGIFAASGRAAHVNEQLTQLGETIDHAQHRANHLTTTVNNLATQADRLARVLRDSRNEAQAYFARMRARGTSTAERTGGKGGKIFGGKALPGTWASPSPGPDLRRAARTQGDSASEAGASAPSTPWTPTVGLTLPGINKRKRGGQ